MISRTELPNFQKKFDVVSVFINHGTETLLLLRQDFKPQGNTWAMVAGKVKVNEDLTDALIREIKEEIGLEVLKSDLEYFEKYFVRYPEYDYLYHIYYLEVKEKPILNISIHEHKDHSWIKPHKALSLNLIPHEDDCIKWFFGIE
jgi:ADP-ribose pyrophosphatase YjhB (NUDIX family)